jgi:hypothetical protein
MAENNFVGERNISSELLAALLNKQQINKDNTITLVSRLAGRNAVGNKRISWRVEENQELKDISTRSCACTLKTTSGLLRETARMYLMQVRYSALKAAEHGSRMID